MIGFLRYPAAYERHGMSRTWCRVLRDLFLKARVAMAFLVLVAAFPLKADAAGQRLPSRVIPPPSDVHPRISASTLLAAATSPAAVRGTRDDLPAPSPHAGAGDARALPPGWVRTQTHHLDIQYDPDHRGGVKRLVEQGDALLESTADRLGIQPSRRYVVRIAKGRETFEREQPGKPPPWAAGTAYPKYGLMVLLTGEGALWRLPNGFEKVFVHECSHLLLGDVAGNKPFPRWFDEGVARLMAGEFSMEEWTLLSRGVLFGKLIWFSQLDRGFPIAESRANLAYAQSRSFLSYLTKQFGPGVLPAIVKDIAKGNTLNDALWHVVGRGLNTLEDEWRADLGRDMKWISALFGGATLWGLMGVLVILAYLKRKAQSRQRRARWAEEEAGWFDEIPVPIETRLQFQWIASLPRRRPASTMTQTHISTPQPGVVMLSSLEKPVDDRRVTPHSPVRDPDGEPKVPARDVPGRPLDGAAGPKPGTGSSGNG